MGSAYIRGSRTAVSFLLAVYLLCMSHLDTLAPEYRFLRVSRPPGWDNPEMEPRCWRSLGEVLAIYAVSQSTLLQWPLNTGWPNIWAKSPCHSTWSIYQSSSFSKDPCGMSSGLWPHRNPCPTLLKQVWRDVWCDLYGVCHYSWLITSLVAELWNRFVDEKCLGV